jgi:hypothetical protein
MSFAVRLWYQSLIHRVLTTRRNYDGRNEIFHLFSVAGAMLKQSSARWVQDAN